MVLQQPLLGLLSPVLLLLLPPSAGRLLQRRALLALPALGYCMA